MRLRDLADLACSGAWGKEIRVYRYAGQASNGPIEGINLLQILRRVANGFNNTDNDVACGVLAKLIMSGFRRGWV